MSDSKSNSGSQAVQTVLVVLVSVLLTALLVLLLSKKMNGGGLVGNQTDSGVILTGAESEKELAARISRDSQELGQRLDMLNSSLKTAIEEKENALKAREGYTDQVLDYKNEIDKLELQLREAKSSVTQNNLLIEELNLAKLANESSQKEATSYLRQIQELKDADQSQSLVAENKALQAKLDQRQIDLEIAQKKINKLGNAWEEIQEAKAQAIAYKQENEELRKSLANLKFKYNRVNLFVKEASSLDPKVSELYNALVALKNQSGTDLDVAYTELQGRLKVRKLRHVKFGEGSAFVSDLEDDLIRKDIADSAANSFILVVGYASNTGSTDANYELSAKRATSVATTVDGEKSEGQQVKAVFLGQTSRFSPNTPSENQVCEIWEVLK